MSRTRGSEKTGGRQRGTPNKVTAELKGWITDLLLNGREQFKKDMQDLTPRERIKAHLALLQYVLPKMQALSTDGQTLMEAKAIRDMMQSAPDEYLEILADKISNDSRT